MSARRTAPLEWLAPIGIIVVGLIVSLSPQAVDAQCSEGGAPSCCTCHAETHPVASQGEWHEEHARRDCCWYCHGGNTQTQDKRWRTSAWCGSLWPMRNGKPATVAIPTTIVSGRPSLRWCSR